MTMSSAEYDAMKCAACLYPATIECASADCPQRVARLKPRPEAVGQIPVDSQARKDTPVYSGVLAYFPLALAAVAQLSKAGNDKHNPGQPLHWSKDKSNDHLDCIARHLLEAGTVDPDDGFLHDVKLAWRALANLQRKLET